MCRFAEGVRVATFLHCLPYGKQWHTRMNNPGDSHANELPLLPSQLTPSPPTPLPRWGEGRTATRQTHATVRLDGSAQFGPAFTQGGHRRAGLVGPGNSPGILAATSVDPSGGLDFAFEFTQANPDYTNAAASGNDLLSISGLTPFTSSLTSANVVSIYFTPAAAELGGRHRADHGRGHHHDGRG